MAKSYSKKARGIMIAAQAVEGIPAKLGTASVTGTLSAAVEGTFTTRVTLSGGVVGTGILTGTASTTTFTGTVSGIFTGAVNAIGTIDVNPLMSVVAITGGTSGSGVILSGATVTVLTLSGIAATNGLACFEPTYDTEISSDTLEYAGSEFSRDTRTDFTDRVMNVGCSTLLPSLGIPNGTADIEDFPQAVLFSSTGAAVTFSGSDGSSLVKVSNETTSTTKATVLVTAVSSDDNTVEKIYKGFDGNAVMDLELEIDKRVKLKWNMKSIPADWAASPEVFPDEIVKIEPDYGVQKTEVMPTLSLRNVTQAQLEVYGSKKYLGVALSTSGNADLPTPFYVDNKVKNFCFSKITANAFFGFSWERVHNSCQTGFEKLAMTPDVMITILEDDIQAVLQPDTNVTEGGMLEGYFAFALTFGTVAGKKAHVTFDKLQCVNVKNTEVGSRAAKELTFKNCSFSTLMWNSAV
jgi:hypothetical protein